jgi:8-oxo-dGTP pyrophosphatase MutT (NUDIX family)
MSGTPSLELIRRRIASYGPSVLSRPPDAPAAAVALILHEPAGKAPEILFIERARREGDPWSGQMALPGGRHDPSDDDLRSTALRETHEEVGLSLGGPIGRLDDVHGSRGLSRLGLVVSPFVFELHERAAVRHSEEVQDSVWVPLPHLLDPSSAVHYRFERHGVAGTFPAVRYERYTIWGLTYKILTVFSEVLGRELAAPGPDSETHD